MKSDDYLNKVCTITEHIINYVGKIVESDIIEIRKQYADEVFMELHKLGWIQQTIYGEKALNEREHKVICSWCKKLLKDGIEPISHGICPDCKTKLLEEL